MEKRDVRRCVNGHYYDGQMYEFCPHCGASTAEAKNKSNTNHDSSDNKNMDIKFLKKKSSNEKKAKNGKNKRKTVGMFNDDYSEENSKSEHNDSLKSASFIPREEEKEKSTEREVIFAKSDYPEKVADNKNVENRDDNDVQDGSVEEISKLKQTENGKTFGYFHVDKERGKSGASSEPVVGWLVCVKGSHFGESFNIFSGKNSLGRGTDNLIVISDDQSVSRIKHAWITYEPKKRNFYIAPGESSGLTYLNDELVDRSQIIKAFDIVEIGKTLFVFVPLCGEKFTWDNYIQE